MNKCVESNKINIKIKTEYTYLALTFRLLITILLPETSDVKTCDKGAFCF